MQLADVRARLDAALDAALDEATTRLVEGTPALEEPAALLRQANAGGKRIRPILVVAGHQIVAGDHEAAIGPAMAAEFLHLCALLHDDIIDEAATRRGAPSFHVAEAERHRAAGLRGDAAAHGRAVALLFGDLAFVLADEAFLASSAPADQLIAAQHVFTAMREEVMRGQFLDVDAAARRRASPEQAEAIARLKSGRYTVRRPVEIGATLAGASDQMLTLLAAWGEPLGLAFQMTDDLLGVFGHSNETGKDQATDLREGKRTVLVAEALAALPADDAAQLDERLGDASLGAEELAWMRGAIEDSGARAAVEGRVGALLAEARDVLAAIASLPHDPDGFALLQQVTDALASRDR